MFSKANRISGMALSEIVQLSEAAGRLRAEGQDVLSFATGEPDFPTPAHIRAAATAAMNAGDTRYPPTAGTAALRKAVARQAHGTQKAENVIICTGAKQVIANAFAATLNAGDEVIIPAPYWSTYIDCVQLFEGRPVVIPCDATQGFKLTAAQLEAAITPKTKWLMLNSPSNPSGAVYTAAELAEVQDVLLRHPHVWLLSDEIYEHICYVPFASATTSMPKIQDRLLIVNGVSKAHSMTGWRIGWGISTPELIRAMTTVQGQITSGASTLSQAAAVAALEGGVDHLESRRRAFQNRRDMVCRTLNAITGLSCAQPEGAFYMFPSCQALLGQALVGGHRVSDDSEFCRFVLEKSGLVLVPGRAFGMPNHFRLSYAYAEEALRDGLERLGEVTRLR